MKGLIRKVFNVDEGEETPFILLFLNAFFSGVFLITYDVGASTLFLDTVGEGELTKSIMITGGLGILTTGIFANLQTKIKFSHLTIGSLLFLSLFVLVLSLALEFDPGDKILIYAAFIFLGPINAVVLLGFVGSIRRSFSVRGAKKMIDSDNGQMVGTTLSSIIFPFITFSHTANYFFISAGSIIISALFMMIFIRKYLRKVEKSTGAVISQQASIKTLAGDRFIRILALLVFFSIVATFTVENSFLSTVSKKFQGKELSDFLLFFGLALNIINVLLQTLVGDRVVEMYGVKTGLLILPLLLFLFTILSSFVGTAFGFEGEALIVFLLFISLTKLFLNSTRDAFEEPIFKNLLIAVDSNVRLDVEAKIKGVFNQFSIMIAGVVLVILGLINFFTLVHYSYFLIFIAVGYAFFAGRLYNAYQKTLKSTLTNQQGIDRVNTTNEYSSLNILRKELQNSEPEKIINTLKLMEKIEPVLLEKSAEELVYDSSDEVKKFAINKIDDLKSFQSVSALKNCMKLEESPEIKQLVNKTLEDFEKAESIALIPERITTLVKSKNSKDRYFAARILFKANYDHQVQHILDLMRDTEPEVKKAAIVSAGKIKKPELWPLMADHLHIPSYANTASAALYNIGDEIVPFLESCFFKTGQTIETMLKIVQIYGRLGTPKAVEALWSKIDFPDKKILGQVLYSLSNCGKQATDDYMVRIRQTIEHEVGKSAWDICALTEIGKDNSANHLKLAILDEISHNDQKIFMLLALIYDRKNVQLVKENIENRTVEGVLFAIELLNIFISDELKPLIFPLLDEMPIEEKIQKLQIHYPRPVYSETEVLLQIINRDYNLVNKWTKACAIYKYKNMQGAKVCDDLIANLFNPDSLLRETTAYVICCLDMAAYELHTQRIHPQIKKELDGIVIPASKNPSEVKNLRIEKILFLKSLDIYANIPGSVISGFAELMTEFGLPQGNSLVHSDKYDAYSHFLVGNGKLGKYEGNVRVDEVTKGAILTDELLNDLIIEKADIIAEEPTRIFKYEKEKFFELLADHFEFASGFIPEYNNKIAHTYISQTRIKLDKVEEEII